MASTEQVEPEQTRQRRHGRQQRAPGADPDPTPATTAALARIPWSLWGQALIIVLGAFTSMLSSTIANPALPAMAAGLHTTGGAVRWVATGYLLALAAGVPLSGWAGRRLGVTRLWLGSLALFCAFSVWCALSGTIAMLIIGRVLQGLAGGLLVPAGQTITGIVAGRERLGRIMSTIGIAIVLAPTLGTTLGGVMLGHLAWTWLFWLNVPLCAVAFAAGAAFLPRVPTGEAGRLDRLGLLLVIGGLPLLTYGVSAIGDAHGLGSVRADLCTAGGLLLLTAFAAWSLRATAPLLWLRLFTDRVFAASSAVMFSGGAVNFGAQMVLPLYFTDVRHESLLAAGLLIGPQVIGTALGFPLAGRLCDQYGSGTLLVAGGVITAVATVPLALVGGGTGYAWLGTVLFVRGLGVALGTIPAMTAGLAAVRPDRMPDAAPLLNMLQRTGASLGTTLVVVLYGAQPAGPGQAVEAFRHVSWWLFAGACLLALPAVLLARAERTATR